jgi:hypothetical protein
MWVERKDRGEMRGERYFECKSGDAPTGDINILTSAAGVGVLQWQLLKGATVWVDPAF